MSISTSLLSKKFVTSSSISTDDDILNVRRTNEFFQLTNPSRENIFGRVDVVSEPRSEPITESEEGEDHVDDVLEDVTEEDIRTHQHEDELGVAEERGDEGSVLRNEHGDVDDHRHGRTEEFVSDVDGSDAHQGDDSSGVDVGGKKSEEPFDKETEEARDGEIR